MDANQISQIVAIGGGILGAAFLFVIKNRWSNITTAFGFPEAPTVIPALPKPPNGLTIDNLNQQIVELRKDVDEARSDRDKKSEEIGRLQAQIETLNQKISGMEAANVQDKATSARIAVERDKERDENRKLMEKYTAANQTIVDQVKEITALEKRVSVLEHDNAVAVSAGAMVSEMTDKIVEKLSTGIQALIKSNVAGGG